MAFCKNCGTPVDDSAKFCPHCGTPIDEHIQEVVEVEPVLEPQPLEKRLLAIFAYLDLFIVIYLIVCRRDDEFLAHHANQALVGMIFLLVFCCVVFIGWILLIPLLVFVILNMVAAGHSRLKKMPIIGGIKIIKRKID